MTPAIPPFPLFLDGDTRVMVYTLTAREPTAPPVVFLHGWGLPPQSYGPYLHALSERLSCDVLAPALPGFGGSDPLRSADDTALLAHLTRTLPELDLHAPPLFIGHSLGAALAARLAGQVNPPALDPRLVLISPAGVRHGSGWGLGKAMSMALELRHDLPYDPLARLQDAGPSFLRHPRAAVQAGWTASQIDIRADLARLVDRRARVFLVTADEDRVTPHEDARAVPGIHVETVRGTHGWLLSHPQEAAQVTERLLRPSA